MALLGYDTQCCPLISTHIHICVHIYVYTTHIHTHTNTHPSMLFRHITVCLMFQSVHLMNQSVTSFLNQSVTSFLPLSVISSLPLPSGKNSTAMVVNGTESSIMLMKSIKRLLELASLCTEFLSVSCSLSCLTPSSSVAPVCL